MTIDNIATDLVLMGPDQISNENAVMLRGINIDIRFCTMTAGLAPSWTIRPAFSLCVSAHVIRNTFAPLHARMLHDPFPGIPTWPVGGVVVSVFWLLVASRNFGRVIGLPAAGPGRLTLDDAELLCFSIPIVPRGADTD